MPQMSKVLRERAIGMLTAGMSRADGRQREWRCVGKRFADVNVVDRVAHGGGGVMVWAVICYGPRTQVH